MLERRSVFMVAAIVIVTLVLAFGCASTANKNMNIDFNQLINSANKYNDKTVTVEGYYFSGFEIVVLTGSLQPSTFAEGNVNPTVPMIWLTGNFPQDIHTGLNVQNNTPSGYPEYYGKIKVTGKFEFGGKYGHLNAFNYQIDVNSVEKLAWTPAGNLGVLVTDENGTPLWGAKVVSEEQPEGQLKVTGITGNDGKVTFQNIKAGTYKFYISRFDYINQELTVPVTITGSVNVTVKLLKDSQSVPTT